MIQLSFLFLFFFFGTKGELGALWYIYKSDWKLSISEDGTTTKAKALQPNNIKQTQNNKTKQTKLCTLVCRIKLKGQKIPNKALKHKQKLHQKSVEQSSRPNHEENRPSNILQTQRGLNHPQGLRTNDGKKPLPKVRTPTNKTNNRSNTDLVREDKGGSLA